MKILNRYSALFLLLFCISIFAKSQPLAANQLSQLLNHFTTFQADFMQKTFSYNRQLLQKSDGSVEIMRPGNFRWTTQKPTRQLVITNGKTLWIYDVDLQQVTTQPVDQGPMSPAKLLSGQTITLLKQFDVHMIPHKSAVVFQLIPKQSNQQFRSISMAFVNNQLHSMQIQNNLEQTTIFTFSNVKINSRLSSSQFNFKAPKGVDVLR